MNELILQILRNAGLTIIEILIIVGLAYWCSCLHKAIKQLDYKVNDLQSSKNIINVKLANICKKLDYITIKIDNYIFEKK